MENPPTYSGEHSRPLGGCPPTALPQGITYDFLGVSDQLDLTQGGVYFLHRVAPSPGGHLHCILERRG